MKPKWIALAILLLLQAGDFLSTKFALAVPGVVELNPLVRTLGLVPAKLLVLGLVLVLIYRAEKLLRIWILCGTYSAIVASNLALAWRPQ